MPEKWKGLWQEEGKKFPEGKPEYLTVLPKSMNLADPKFVVISMEKL